MEALGKLHMTVTRAYKVSLEREKLASIIINSSCLPYPFPHHHGL